jgi:hypothetical protein
LLDDRTGEPATGLKLEGDMRVCHGLAVTSLTLMMPWIAACSGTSQTLAVRDFAASGKITQTLLNAAQQLQRGVSLPANGPVRSDVQGRLQVYVHVSSTAPEAVAALASHGLQDTAVSPEMNIIQGWVSPANLANLAALSFVTRITPPRYAHPR